VVVGLVETAWILQFLVQPTRLPQEPAAAVVLDLHRLRQVDQVVVGLADWAL
jgi:hypothetical protein